MSGKTTRKVTVESSSRLSADSPSLSSSHEQSSKMKKRSVFERLGTASGGFETVEKCRTFLRDGDCPFGKKCKYSHDIDAKRSRKSDKLYLDRGDNEYDYYDDSRGTSDKKKGRKLMDNEKLKIEFKKDNVLKNKQTIEEMYDEKAPAKKGKKDKKDKVEDAFSSKKKSHHDELMVDKEGYTRSIHSRGDEKKDKKNKDGAKLFDYSKEDDYGSHPKKQKKKKYQEESEDELKHKDKGDGNSTKKKKKKKPKYSSTDDESEDERSRKKKTKKEKHKSYESDDSSIGKQKKKMKHADYERHVDVQSGNEQRKKKKKRRDKYDSEDDEQSDGETYLKSEKAHEEERSKKNHKHVEDEVYEHDKKRKFKSSSHNVSPKNEKVKEQSKQSLSPSVASESVSYDSNDEIMDKRENKRNKYHDKGYKEDKKKERKNEKYKDNKTTHKRSHEDNKDSSFHDERRRDHKTNESHSREHYTQPQQQQQQQHHPSANQESSSYDTWDRDRPSYDDQRNQPSQRNAPTNYVRGGRSQGNYRQRYDVHNKDNDDRQQYRQYSDQQYNADDARYRSNRGGREEYGHHGYRRGGFQDEEGYQGGRTRDFYQGYQQGTPAEDRRRYRGEYPSGKDADAGPGQRDKKKDQYKGHRASRSPVARKRGQSLSEEEGEADKSRSKKRKREEPPSEKDQSLERNGKKAKTQSDAESGSGNDGKLEDGKKQLVNKDKRSKGYRESGGPQKKDEAPDERRDRRSEKGSRERDRRYNKRGSSNERGPRRERNSSRSERERREESISKDESQGNKVEDKRIKTLKSSSRNSPSNRNEQNTAGKTQKKNSSNRGRGDNVDDDDLNLDDVYEKISDEELDFFEDEGLKSQKPASLEDVDWSALAAITPASKGGDQGDTSSVIAKHSAINVLRSIGFSSNCLSKNVLEKIREKELNENDNKCYLTDFSGTGALVLSKFKQREHRRNLIFGLKKDGNVLSMRKDIDIRKELSLPANKLGMNGSLFCRAPSSPADGEMFTASSLLFKKILPGETTSSSSSDPLRKFIHFLMANNKSTKDEDTRPNIAETVKNDKDTSRPASARSEAPPGAVAGPYDTSATLLSQYGYLLGQSLGKGSYAVVKSAHSKKHKRKVAIKIISKKKAPDDYLVKFLPREIQVLKRLRHQNCITLLEAIETNSRIYLIMNVADNGDLLEYIRSNGPLSDDNARSFYIQLISATDYFHSLGIVHRDLKCENLLLDQNYNILVSDFGFARASMIIPETNRHRFSQTFCGSYAYAPPEILRGIAYDGMLSDIWSLGVVLYTMVSASLPFDDSHLKTLLEQVMRPIHFSSRKNISPEVKDLICRMLQPDVKKRIVIADIREHIWYKGEKFPPQVEDSTNLDQADESNQDHVSTSREVD
eukprot:gene11080-12248_t